MAGTLNDALQAKINEATNTIVWFVREANYTFDAAVEFWLTTTTMGPKSKEQVISAARAAIEK